MALSFEVKLTPDPSDMTDLVHSPEWKQAVTDLMKAMDDMHGILPVNVECNVSLRCGSLDELNEWRNKRGMEPITIEVKPCRD